MMARKSLRGSSHWARKSPTTPQNPLMYETLRKDPEASAASPLAARGEDGGEGFWDSVATKAANPHPALSL